MSENKASKIFQENVRKTHLHSRIETFILFVFTLLLGTAALITIGLLQYDEYDAYLKQRLFYISSVAGFCGYVDFYNFDALSTPIAGLLIIIYILLYKRRSLCTSKFKCRYFGLPMIVSCWNKTDRSNTAFVYGRIAFEVFTIVQSFFEPDKATTVKMPNDPTGLFNLLMRIFQVILIGIRYYPVLVAFRAKSFTMYALSAIYMWIDYGNTIYQAGVCTGISEEVEDYNTDEIKKVVVYYIGYRVLMETPTLFFQAYISLSLTYKALITLKNDINDRKMNKKISKCIFCQVNDDHEVFYSHYDILYVINLFKRQSEFNEYDDKKKKKELKAVSKLLGKVNKTENDANGSHSLATPNDVHLLESTRIPVINDIKPKPENKIKAKLRSMFHKYIYHPQLTFRFTSRFLNIHVVALVTLYHVFIIFLYYMVKMTTDYGDYIPDSIDWSNVTVDFGSILCSISSDICFDGIKQLNNVPLPLPKTVVKFGPQFKSSFYAMFLAPIFCALLICIIQIFLGIRDTKKHLIEIYKGSCHYVPPIKTLPNSSIASSSFHYGGYLVGYVIWGYFIIYIFIVFIALAITFIRLFIGDQTFEKILLKMVPVICGIVVKQAVNMLASRVIFLRRDTRVLALNNFRAFNVFLYFSFFFDCFMGFISAVTRIVKTSIAGVFMMPRIAYSFMGRYLERKDNGYSAYVGYLYMEANHTNPILITFLSLLYYKGLAEHIQMWSFDDDTKKKKFLGLQHDEGDTEDGFNKDNKQLIYLKALQKKTYKKHIVNKWHVMVMLTKNPILVMYRKGVENDDDDDNDDDEVVESKSKRCFNKIFCCCCKKQSKKESNV